MGKVATAVPWQVPAALPSVQDGKEGHSHPGQKRCGVACFAMEHEARATPLDERTRELRNAVLDAGGSLLEEQGELCATLVYDSDQWEHVRHSPLGWNIERDGIAI